jgi:hypothetical protein
MLSRLLGRKLPELATDNVNFLENRFEIRPCDIIVAYAPIGERLQREKGLLSLEDSSHSIFLACFVHKDFMKRNPAAIQSFDRLFRMVYKSYVKSPERAMDRLLSLPSFIAAYHRSSGYGKCATKKAK